MMEKTVMVDIKVARDFTMKHRINLYRVASVKIDKVTLEKHEVCLMNNLTTISLSCKINDDTKVGVITQKMVADIIDEISKKVDCVAVDFIMKDKLIIKINFDGVIE
jgi:hypothetical protein